VRTLMAAFTLFGSLTLAASVHAQAAPLAPGSTIALLPGGDLPAASDGPYARHALKAVQEAVRKLGYEAITPDRVRKRLGGTEHAALCETPSGCDYEELMRVLGVDAVAIYSLWLRDSQPHEFAVGVVRKDRPGSQGEANQLIADKAFETVVAGILAAALNDAENPHTVVVTIESQPPGVSVVVDRRFDGVTPAKFDLSPGQHQVQAAKDGHVSLLDYFEVPEDRPSYRHRIELPPAEAAPRVIQTQEPTLDPGYTDEPDAPSKTVDYVVSGVLAAGAVGLLAYGLATLDSEGTCTRSDPDEPRCSQVSSPKAVTLVALVSGGVALAASTVIFVLTPISDANTPAASVHVHGTF
jgi:hypothetical protein